MSAIAPKTLVLDEAFDRCLVVKRPPGNHLKLQPERGVTASPAVVDQELAPVPFTLGEQHRELFFDEVGGQEIVSHDAQSMARQVNCQNDNRQPPVAGVFSNGPFAPCQPDKMALHPASSILLGVDLAERTTPMHAVDAGWRVLVAKVLAADKFAAWCAQLPPGCLVAMAACGDAHHWARKPRSYGLGARLITGHFVTPYRMAGKGGKNDAAKAAAQLGGIGPVTA